MIFSFHRPFSNCACVRIFRLLYFLFFDPFFENSYSSFFPLLPHLSCVVQISIISNNFFSIFVLTINNNKFTQKFIRKNCHMGQLNFSGPCENMSTLWQCLLLQLKQNLLNPTLPDHFSIPYSNPAGSNILGTTKVQLCLSHS